MNVLKDKEGNEYLEHPSPDVVTVLPGDTFDFEWHGQKMRVCGYATVHPTAGVIWYPPNHVMMLERFSFSAQ